MIDEQENEFLSKESAIMDINKDLEMYDQEDPNTIADLEQDLMDLMSQELPDTNEEVLEEYDINLKDYKVLYDDAESSERPIMEHVKSSVMNANIETSQHNSIFYQIVNTLATGIYNQKPRANIKSLYKNDGSPQSMLFNNASQLLDTYCDNYLNVWDNFNDVITQTVRNGIIYGRAGILMCYDEHSDNKFSIECINPNSLIVGKYRNIKDCRTLFIKYKYSMNMLKMIYPGSKIINTNNNNKMNDEIATDKTDVNVIEIYCKTQGLIITTDDKFTEVLDIRKFPGFTNGDFPILIYYPERNTDFPTLPVLYWSSVSNSINNIEILQQKINMCEDNIEAIMINTGADPADLTELKYALSGDIITVKSPIVNNTGSALGLQWVDNSGLIQTIEKLELQKKQKLDDIFRSIGIADIVLGAPTAPGETATAQLLKQKYDNRKILPQIRRIEDLCKMILKHLVTFVCNYVDDSEIYLRAGEQFTGDPEQVQVIELIRNSMLKHVLFDIETDSTVALLDQTKKAEVIEQVQTIATIIQGVSAASTLPNDKSVLIILKSLLNHFPLDPSIVEALDEKIKMISDGMVPAQQLDDATKQLEAIKNGTIYKQQESDSIVSKNNAAANSENIKSLIELITNAPAGSLGKEFINNYKFIILQLMDNVSQVSTNNLRQEMSESESESESESNIIPTVGNIQFNSLDPNAVEGAIANAQK